MGGGTVEIAAEDVVAIEPEEVFHGPCLQSRRKGALS